MNREGRAIRGGLAGAGFSFRTDLAELADYAALHLAPLCGADAAGSDLVIDAELAWQEGPPPRDRLTHRPELADMERIDRDLYLGNGEIVWFRIDECRDLHLRFRWDGNRLSVRGDFHWRVTNHPTRDRLWRWLAPSRVADLRRRRFTTLLYYLVYYPCWWWLEEKTGKHPVHAAGVQLRDRLVLLGGASGVGKSTLSVAMAGEPGARLLSDSFVLQDGAEVWAVPEPILLDEWSLRWIGERRSSLTPIDWRYVLGRKGFHPVATRSARGGKPSVLLLPRRAGRTYVRPIPSPEAHARLSSADLIINDLRRYWAFAAVLEQLCPSGLVARREAALARLTAGIPCFEVGITADLDCPTTLAGILAATDAGVVTSSGSDRGGE